MNWQDFFAMGGYALYVWSSYAVAAVILLANLIGARRRHRQALRTLRELSTLDDQA